jgi:hypothetical protein
MVIVAAVIPFGGLIVERRLPDEVPVAVPADAAPTSASADAPTY